MRILFTGGGTGGHIYPILSVVEQLKIFSVQRNVDINLYYLGAPGKFASLLKKNKISVSKILSAKLRRYFDIRNFIDFILFPFSLIQAFWKVFWIMPDVLFSKGGPGSLPVVIACKFYCIPIIIHDSDSIIGLANMLALRFADRIGISFKAAGDKIVQSQSNEKKAEKLRQKIALIGNPIRQSLIEGILEKQNAKMALGIDLEKPLILVMGGSQGSSIINDFMLNISNDLVKHYQILHQTGVDNFVNFKNELNIALHRFGETEKKRYKAIPYFDSTQIYEDLTKISTDVALKDVYAAADIIVSRASAGSIFEIAAFGLPSILIPLRENVVGAHQIMNAYEYVKTGAAIVIEEENLKPHIFLVQLEKIISNKQTLKSMSEAAKKFSKPEAAKMIAEEIVKLATR